MGTMGHICEEQNFNHQLPKFFSTQVCASNLFQISKSKCVSKITDRRQNLLSDVYSGARACKPPAKCLKRHHLQGRQRNRPGSSTGLILSKELKQKISLINDLSQAIEELFKGRGRSSSLEHFKLGKEELLG